MGIFIRKPPCPVCGGKVPFFLPAKIGGRSICKGCAAKIDMQEDIRKGLTLEGLREYMAFYQENQELKDKFTVSRKLDYGFFDTKMIFDFENRLFCMSGQPDKTVFEGAHLKSFAIREDNAPLFEGGPAGLIRYRSTVPHQVAALAQKINIMIVTQCLDDNMDRLDDDEKYKTYQLLMDIPEPFRQFNVEIHLDHPYWRIIRCGMDALAFPGDCPDISGYMQEYQRDVEVMELMARSLMEVAFPGAGETHAGASVRGRFRGENRELLYPDGTWHHCARQA